MFCIDPDATKELWEKATALGSTLSLARIIALESSVADDPSEIVERDKTIAQSNGLIEDRVIELAPEEVPVLFAGISRAMGYKTSVTKPGPDRGVDIVASSDGLGLQEPRIFVEVKHRRAAMGAHNDCSGCSIRTFHRWSRAEQACAPDNRVLKGGRCTCRRSDRRYRTRTSLGTPRCTNLLDTLLAAFGRSRRGLRRMRACVEP
jgi:hypothetical protein